jgi:hypothetical protein
MKRNTRPTPVSVWTCRAPSASWLWAGLFGIACAACAADPNETGTWSVVLHEPNSALLSVAGTSASDVWVVGGNEGDGHGALALHYDGRDWQRVGTGFEGDLWWAHVLGEKSMFVGGSDGAVLRYDGERFERMATPSRDVVFGVWGAAEDDLWAVGGVPEVGPGFVWRYDGTTWRDVTSELPDEARGPNIYKVWGRAANDVWLVGMDGVVVHWDGDAFVAAESSTDRRLFTVHGAARGEPVAVGGFADAVIVEREEAAFHETTPAPRPFQLFGVFMSGPVEGYAVGWEGTVVRRDAAGWASVDTGLDLVQALHAVWIDPRGGVWAVGGDATSAVPSDGIVIHREEVDNAIGE